MQLEEALDRPVLEAAKLLLGATVRSHVGGDTVAVCLDEVEAYDGPNDPASHAYRGRTKRNAPMFERPGTLYVYRSYGLHWCMNVTVGPPGQPSAVLLRGGTIIEGRDTAIRRRGREDHLADGPGKLCQALAVTGHLSGTDPDGTHISIHLDPVDPKAIEATPRIGITKAADRPWRFTVGHT